MQQKYKQIKEQKLVQILDNSEKGLGLEENEIWASFWK